MIIDDPDTVTNIGDGETMRVVNVLLSSRRRRCGDWPLIVIIYIKKMKIDVTIIYRQRHEVIPNSVTSIGETAFSSCASLTCVIIPDGVASIHRHPLPKVDGLEGGGLCA